MDKKEIKKAEKRQKEREIEILKKIDCKNENQMEQIGILSIRVPLINWVISPCRLLKAKANKKYMEASIRASVPFYLFFMLVFFGDNGPLIDVLEPFFILVVIPTVVMNGLLRILSVGVISSFWYLALMAFVIASIVGSAGIMLVVYLFLWQVASQGKKKSNPETVEDVEQKEEAMKEWSAHNLIDESAKKTIEELEEEGNPLLNQPSIFERSRKIDGYSFTTPINLYRSSKDPKKTVYLDNFAYFNEVYDGFLNEVSLRGEVGREIIKEQLKYLTNTVVGKVAPIDFTKTVMAIGGMGSGKTEFFNSLLDQDWYARAVINDIKGDFTQKFYRPEKDIILNLFDTRSHYWDIFEEMKSNPQIVVSFVSNLMMASVGGKPDFWLNSAKKVLIDNFMKIGFSSLSTVEKYQALIAELEKYKEDAKDDKTKSSISVTMDLGIEIFQLISYRAKDKNAKSFTLNEFLNSNDGQRLFLLNNQAYSEKLTPFFVGFISALTNTMLGKADTKTDLTFLLLDEFYSLKFEEETRIKLLTAVRSKGGCIVAGMQYIDSKTETKQIMDSSRYAMLVFQVNDEVTVNRIVSMFGDVKYLSTDYSKSFGDKEIGNTGLTVSTTNASQSINEKSEKLITPKLLQSMPKYTHLTIIPSEELLYLGYTKMVEKETVNENFLPIDMQSYYQSLFGKYEANAQVPVQDDYSNYTEEELFTHWYKMKFAGSEEKLLEYIEENELYDLDIDRLYQEYDENEKALKEARERYSNDDILKIMDDFFKINDDKKRFEFAKKMLLIGTLLALFKLDSDWVLEKAMEGK